jgi:hypothetical protein
MFRRLISAIGVTYFALSLTASGGQDDVKRDDLKIVVQIPKDKGPYNLGDTISADIFLKNVSQKPIVVRDWRVLGGEVWKNKLLVLVTLHVKGEQILSLSPWESMGGPVSIEELKTLAPGESLEAGHWEAVLMCAGSAYITAAYISPISGWPASSEGSAKAVENLWHYGTTVDCPIETSEKMSAAMKARYEKAAKALADEKLDAQSRIELLDKITAEKHVFAARFVVQAWREAKDPGIKAAAFNGILDLLEFGTAYEIAPEMVGWLKDDALPTEARKRILGVVGKMYLGRPDPMMIVAGGQAAYVVPEGLRKDLLEAVKSLSAGRDPFLASQAKEILEKVRSEASAYEAIGAKPSPTKS